jgi:hypothetical protein
MTIRIIQGGYQKDAEEFFGFISTRWKKSFWPCWRLFLLFLRTQVQRILRPGRTRNLDLLLALASPMPLPTLPTQTRSRNRLCRMMMRMEMNSWRLGSGIGQVVTHMVCLFFLSLFRLCRVFQCFVTSFVPCLLTSSSIFSFTDTAFTHAQIKGTEFPITRIFGGKFRSTLRGPGQKDSVLVEGWRALRLDIQVYIVVLFLL